MPHERLRGVQGGGERNRSGRNGEFCASNEATAIRFQQERSKAPLLRLCVLTIFAPQTEYSDKFEGRKGLLSLTKKTEVKNPACGGPIAYTEEGFADLKAEICRVVDAAKAASVPLDRVFFSSPSPGTLATFFDDDFFHDHAKYVAALGAAMKREYDAIYEAGLMLQVDCPDLAMGRHTRHKALSLTAFQAAARTQVDVMNAALADIPADRMRMHVCWGNYPCAAAAPP